MSKVIIKLKRVYDPVGDDGLRILVDRLWPRGVSKDKVDVWFRDVAPTHELRRWYSHDPDRWIEFKQRYLKELENNPHVSELIELIRGRGVVTLLYASRDRARNNAVVLKEYLESKLSGL